MGGGGANYMSVINERAKDWRDMAKVDMGSLINEMATEMNGMLDAMITDFEENPNYPRSAYKFKYNGELNKYLNGYDINNGGALGDDFALRQSMGLHSITMTRKGLADFLDYLNNGKFNGYGDFARDELSKMNTRGRRKRR